MPHSLNRVTLIGHLGKDPVTKETKSHTKITAFNLATSYSWKVGDEWKEKDTWHRVICWGNLADKASIFLKGDAVFVEGRLDIRDYTDKENVKRNITEVIAEHVYLFAPKLLTPTGKPSEDDEIPF
jgi:single-strand DNA-binding protein